MWVYVILTVVVLIWWRCWVGGSIYICAVRASAGYCCAVRCVLYGVSCRTLRLLDVSHTMRAAAEKHLSSVRV